MANEALPARELVMDEIQRSHRPAVVRTANDERARALGRASTKIGARVPTALRRAFRCATASRFTPCLVLGQDALSGQHSANAPAGQWMTCPSENLVRLFVRSQVGPVSNRRKKRNPVAGQSRHLRSFVPAMLPDQEREIHLTQPFRFPEPPLLDGGYQGGSTRDTVRMNRLCPLQEGQRPAAVGTTIGHACLVPPDRGRVPCSMKRVFAKCARGRAANRMLPMLRPAT